MSRIGRMPISIPSGVKVEYKNRTVTVKGPKGELQQEVRPEVDVFIEDAEIKVKCVSEHRKASAFHGLYRSLIANMVEGVTDGFSKKLEIVGVGYRAGKEKVQGQDCIVFKKGELGFSHPIYFALPDGIQADVPERTKIVISGIDKGLVGLVAAKIRDLRPPDSYKGKGIRYAGEVVRTKVGKSGA